jgi:hypothetical protein
MLLAEIHGKHAEVIEANEDYLTSAVFGHLRLVPQNELWRALFETARSVDGSNVSLMKELAAAGVTLATDCAPTMLFWPMTSCGEPDILVHLRSSSGPPVVIVIEVKLYAQKSSVGEDDQLCRYFNLLHKHEELKKLFGADLAMPEVALIYLTERFAAAEVLESASLSTHANAGTRMYPLQWQDLTALIRELSPPRDSAMGEVLRFLQRRNYDHFGGFRRFPAAMVPPTKGFYATTYFARMAEHLTLLGTVKESFYGK